VKNDFFSLTKNVPITALLRDYGTFRWEGFEMLIQPAPGHTPGSIALVTEVDGKKIAFSGDLMHSPGKVQTLYDLQYYYQEHEGVDFSLYSLAQRCALEPDLLCPSHGREFADPIAAMQQLLQKLRQWFQECQPGSRPPTLDSE